MAVQRKKLIVDTDGGIDDAQAIFMMLDSTVYDVIGITCVRGNSDVDQVVRNVLKILAAAGKSHIPVFRGCDCSIVGEVSLNLKCRNYHGDDGLGDSCCEEPDLGLLQNETAVETMIRLSKDNPGEITLMCIGPLTNLGTALKQDKHFGSRLRDCFILGGNYYGRGNATVSAEFNFFADPEAACVVLSQLRCPKTLVGLEIFTESAITWDEYDQLRNFPGKKNQFLKCIEGNAVACSRRNGQDYCSPDAVLAAIMLNSGIVLQSRHIYTIVEISGKLTRGRMVIDWDQQLQKNPNINIVTKINDNLFFRELLKIAKV